MQRGVGQVSLPLKMSMAQLPLSVDTDACREARAGAGECRGCYQPEDVGGIAPAGFGESWTSMSAGLLCLTSTSVHKPFKK